MRRYVFYAAISVCIICTQAAAVAGVATDWLNRMVAMEGPGGIGFGASPGQQDGYDGQPAIAYPSENGVYLELYRRNSDAWPGQTGFYGYDYESPIPNGGSKTWWDIYLWSYNYTPTLGNRVETMWYSPYKKPPTGYTAIVTIDYVPASLNWTGPWEFVWDLNKTSGALLPVPITSDPYNPDNVTRMHLTVYTTPEPSSLAGVGLALASVGIGVLRRRR